MTTNNISQKQILSYLISTLNYWNINYISQQTIKSCKKNNSSVVKQMKQLLFHLILLHIFNYSSSVQQYLKEVNILAPSGKREEIRTGLEQQMEEVILAYLSECECPMMVELINQQSRQNKSEENRDDSLQSNENKVEYFMGCNLQSSRNIFLVCGWVMAISDYFNQILGKYIIKLQQKLQNPERFAKVIDYLVQNSNLLSSISQQNPTECQQILLLFKSIKCHQYQIDCYKEKKQKIRSKYEAKLKKVSSLTTNGQQKEILTFDDILNSNCSSQNKQQKIDKIQAELKQTLINEIQNMKERKYFWIWLQEKIIKEYQNQLKKQNEQYQELQYESQGKINKFNSTNKENKGSKKASINEMLSSSIKKQIKYEINVDLQYLNKYIQLCEYYSDKCNQFTQKLNQLKLVVKRSKQIDNQVNFQFNQKLTTKNHNNGRKHLFIALQIKNYLNLSVNEQNKIKQKQEQQNDKNTEESRNFQGKRKALKKQLKKYLGEIQGAIKFI